MRRPDAAPERGRNARRLHPHILDVKVRQVIDQIDRALGGVGIETVVECRREPSRDHRGAGEAIAPGDRPAFRIEAGGDAVEPIGPVHVVLDVFLAGPHDLDRTVDLLGDLDRAHRRRRPPAAGRSRRRSDDCAPRPCPTAGPRSSRPPPARARSAWLPTQISQPSLRTWTVQFIGSIVACARNGTLVGRLDLGGGARHAPCRRRRCSARPRPA